MKTNLFSHSLRVRKWRIWKYLQYEPQIQDFTAQGKHGGFNWYGNPADWHLTINKQICKKKKETRDFHLAKEGKIHEFLMHMLV